MANPPFKHDVALSFLSTDELIAIQLHDSLSAQLDVFVYSKRQEELAGTEGLATLRQAFRAEARVVVVLYRDGWGKTPWTRVEETAITDRALKEGWDWLLFVMLDSTSTPPKWLPETRIRMNLPDYGLEQIAGATKGRAQEAGSALRRDDAVERAKRHERRATAREERERYLGSEFGVKGVERELQALHAEVLRLAEEIAQSAPTVGLQAGAKDDCCIITTGAASVEIFWHQQYGNTLHGSLLVAREFVGRVLLPQQQGYAVKPPHEVAEHFYEFDVTPERGPCWRGQLDDKYLTSAALADRCVTRVLELTEDVSAGRLKKPTRVVRVESADADDDTFD